MSIGLLILAAILLIVIGTYKVSYFVKNKLWFELSLMAICFITGVTMITMIIISSPWILR